MKNINDYNPIRSINVEAPMTNVKYGEGSYANLIEKCLDGTIDALVNNAGDIVGINYNSGKTGAEDSIAQMIFTRQYSGKDVMHAVLAGFEMKANKASLVSVKEDAYGAEITDSQGHTYRIGDYGYTPHNNSYSDYHEEALPSEVEIDLDELDDDASLASVRHWLKTTYEHCLARGVQPDIDVDDGVVYVSNIEWGRPLSQSELEVL